MAHSLAGNVVFSITAAQLRELRRLPAPIPPRGYLFKSHSILIERGLAIQQGDPAMVRITQAGTAVLAAMACLGIVK